VKDIYRGTLVRLAVESPETMAKDLSRWDHDTETHRLSASAPARLWSEKWTKESIEKHQEANSAWAYPFSIRTLAEDTLIGSVSLWVDSWTHSEAWIGIVIGEREYWGKGYGSEAMCLAVRFGFTEMNLRRISLGLHEYNQRALKSYEKVGFRMEGTMRGEGLRDGQRYNGYYMGILREEWLALAGGGS